MSGQRNVTGDLSRRDRKINVLIVASGLGIGGAEVVMAHLAQRIDRRRFNVTVCCIKVRGPIGDELAREGIDVVTLARSADSKADYFEFLKLLNVIRDRQIDVVHCHTVAGLVAAGFCKLLRPRLKIVHTFHFGNYPNRDRQTMWMEHIFSRLATRLIAVGEVQRRQLRAVFGFREDAIGTVWNGVPVAAAVPPSSFRRTIDAGNRVVIGTIATMIEQKGLFDLLAVASRFRDAGDQVRFVIVGEGPLRSQLEAKRRELGLEDLVIFTGWVPNAAQVALPGFDVFFQPSLWEAMSVVILEAMAAGRAIVATRVGETTCIIEDQVDGLLVNPRDIDGMAKALEQVIRDPELRRRFGAEAARKVAQRFTVEQMTRAYEQIYLELSRPVRGARDAEIARDDRVAETRSSVDGSLRP